VLRAVAGNQKQVAVGAAAVVTSAVPA